MSLSAPELLATEHELRTFSSGVTTLDQLMKRRAMKNQATGASRMFVACDGRRVVVYYCLASSAVEMVEATDRFRRHMPHLIPVVIPLAVGISCQGIGLGRALVRDAGYRVLQAADILGIRGLLVHALSAEAKSFYLHIGFEASALDPMTLMITLSDLQASLARLPGVEG